MTGSVVRCLLSFIAISIFSVAAQASDQIDEIVVTSSRALTSLIKIADNGSNEDGAYDYGAQRRKSYNSQFSGRRHG
jgi:hypothetical protein